MKQTLNTKTFFLPPREESSEFLALIVFFSKSQLTTHRSIGPLKGEIFAFFKFLVLRKGKTLRCMRHTNLRCLHPYVMFCPHVSSLTSSVIHAQLCSLHAESAGCSNKTPAPLKGQEDLHLSSKHQENPPAQQRIWKAGTRVP